MNSKDLIKQINNLESIGKDEIVKLEQLLIEHPYFQSGQLLFTRGLLNTESIRYNQQLKKAAAHSLNRKKLFELITLKSNNNVQLIKKPSSQETKLDMGKPIIFKENESHSFSEW